MSHIRVAHLLKGVSSQRGSSAPSTVQDDAPIGIELCPVVGTGRVGPELEHAPRSMHGARDRTVFLPLFGLPEIDDERIPSFDLVRRLVNRQILDALLGFRYKIRRRLRHCCLLSHGRLPQWPIARCRPL